MMGIVIEYLYCLIYVLALTFSVLYLSKEKVNLKIIIVTAPIYAVVNYLITGNNSIDFLEYIVVNSVTVFLDCIYIYVVLKEVNKTEVFYVTVYQLFYFFSINLIIHIINTISEFNREITLIISAQRFIMVVLINILNIIIITSLNKLGIIPNKKIIGQQAELFIILNILVCYTMMIIFNVEIAKLMNLMMILVLLLLILWVIFLRVLSMYVETTIKNEELIMAEISNQYIDKYIEFYKQESENLRKIKHDLKNHRLVLENLDKMNQYDQYIDEVFATVDQDNYINSGNIYIDACLYAKQQEYRDIRFDYDISINGLVFNENDLTALLFNLIDNACNEAIKHDKLVSIMIKYKNDKLVIIVKNKCMNKPEFTSNRGEEHGYGLKIIKSIINKHEGDLYIDYDDNQVIFNIKFDV